MDACTIVKGEAVAAPYREALVKTSHPAKLLAILANSNPASRHYAQWTQKACLAVGINFQLLVVEEEQGEVELAIISANLDDDVHGILVFYPIFGLRVDSYLQQTVSPIKDVEGLNMVWLFALYHNSRFIDPRSLAFAPSTSMSKTASISDQEGTLVKAILPCTPLAIVKTLEYCQVYNSLLPYGSRAFGRTICVVNRSEVVGRPLAALLANDGARVFSVDLDGVQEFSKRKVVAVSTRPSYHPHHVVTRSELTLQECLTLSDVVISGVPSATFKIKTPELKEGCVAINFSESKNFEASVRERASLYCPGIGKVTITMLQRNLLRLQEYQAMLSIKP